MPFERETQPLHEGERRHRGQMEWPEPTITVARALRKKEHTPRRPKIDPSVSAPIAE